MNRSHWLEEVLSIRTRVDFETLALETFRYQYEHNQVYHNYVEALGIAPTDVKSSANIPFLPVHLFKTHDVRSGLFEPAATFTSSGTSGERTSKHYVRHLDTYEKTFHEAFRRAYGDIREYCILALLPSYLEREGSSLVYMAQHLIDASGHHLSGFYLYDHQALLEALLTSQQAGTKTLLLGVTFALLDFAEAYPAPLPGTIVMETGGMKGRREELTRPEVHELLTGAFSLDAIHSEYGMTELLSQAYSMGGGIFSPPSWMKVSVRESSDPLSYRETGRGGLNIMDLANRDSCAFLATQDLGIVHANGTFEVQGRFDRSDIRGCNLMVA